LRVRNLSSEGWLRQWLLGLGIVISLAGSTQASEYSCRVPRALLCENCATHIAIALQPNGSCRISFNPETAAVGPVAASEAILFTVDEPAVDTIARKAIWRAHYVSLSRPASTTHCFVFNSQKYCE
jgi:hypothetical protein